MDLEAEVDNLLHAFEELVHRPCLGVASVEGGDAAYKVALLVHFDYDCEIARSPFLDLFQDAD